MKTSIQSDTRKQQKLTISPWLVLLSLLTLGLVAVNYYFSEPRYTTEVVKINGAKLVYNYSKSFYSESFLKPDTSSRNQQAAVMAQDGDLIDVDGYLIRHKKGQDSFTIIQAGSFTRIDGKLVGLNLSKRENLLPWFAKMTDDSIRNLEMLSIDTSFSNAYKPYIERIANLHPDISIMYPNNDTASFYKDFSLLTKLFSPKFLLVGLTPEQLAALAPLRNLETLFLAINSGNYTSLPEMPKLRQCFIYSDDTIHLSDSFFRNTSNIKQLSFHSNAIESVRDSLLFLKHLPRLKELVLGDYLIPDVKNLLQLAPGLTVLNLSNHSAHPEVIPKFKHLTWLGLPKSITQKEFDTVIPQMQNLTVLELYGSKAVKSLQSITQLKALKGLIILDTLTDTVTPSQLTNLRYLSLNEDTFEDSNYIKKLEKALPGTVIVPNGGACLGSGWLLLLIPFTVCMLFIRANWKNKNSSYGQ